MDLLLVTGRFPERSETFIYRKATGLAKRGHRVTMAVREVGDRSLFPEPLPPTFRLERLIPDGTLGDPRRALTAAAGALRHAARVPGGAHRLYARCVTDRAQRAEGARQFLRHLPFVDRRVDIVHFEFLSLATMYPLVTEILEAPLVVSCRGSELHNLEALAPDEREAALACLRSAAAVHCVSDELARELARLSGRRDGVWVNRPAVDVGAIAPRPPPSGAGPLRLLAIGRLVWKKGLDYLLAALARLARAGVAFHLDILGEGELRSVLRFSVEDLGLERHVTLAGGVSSTDVLAYMQAADVFVLSSHQEGISNAVLEAMASGVPIVTTDAGGMTEAVRDEVEGFVVPVRDIAALADRIERLARDPTLRARMGRAARARAVAEFSLERQLAGFEAIYRAAREGRP